MPRELTIVSAVPHYSEALASLINSRLNLPVHCIDYLQPLPKNNLLLLHDDASIPFKLYRQQALARSQRYLTFARHFYTPDATIISPVSCDYGSPYRDPGKLVIAARHAHLDFIDRAILTLTEEIEPSQQLAIDIPPDTMPEGHLGRFKSPYRLMLEIMAYLAPIKNHPPILLYRAGGSSAADSRFAQFEAYFKARGKTVTREEELPPNALILTYATDRFFYFHQKGMHVLPITRCLAGVLLHYKRKLPMRDFLRSGITPDGIELLKRFIDGALTIGPDSTGVPLLLEKFLKYGKTPAKI